MLLSICSLSQQLGLANLHAGEDARPCNYALQNHSDDEIMMKCCDRCSNLGSASFVVQDMVSWYTITPPLYPNTVPLSENRNAGFKEGRIGLTSTGLTIRERGNYAINLTATALNPDPSNSVFVLAFLGINGVLDTSIGTSGLIPLQPEGVGQGTISGILKDVPVGTEISILASNGGGSALPVQIVNWNINLFKIPSY